LKSVGYDVYDIYDLGEFDRKGEGVGTKYGTKDELLELAKTAKEHDVVIYVDAVLNHKLYADEWELFRAKEVEANNRLADVTDFHNIGVGMFYSTPGGCLTFLAGLDQVYLPGKER
jgi:alpha-amylase